MGNPGTITAPAAANTPVKTVDTKARKVVSQMGVPSIGKTSLMNHSFQASCNQSNAALGVSASISPFQGNRDLFNVNSTLLVSPNNKGVSGGYRISAESLVPLVNFGKPNHRCGSSYCRQELPKVENGLYGYASVGKRLYMSPKETKNYTASSDYYVGLVGVSNKDTYNAGLMKSDFGKYVNVGYERSLGRKGKLSIGGQGFCNLDNKNLETTLTAKFKFK